MTKQLYEEALADVKKLKEVAEDNAKRALLEALTPRIKGLIETQLLGEAESDEDKLLMDEFPEELETSEEELPMDPVTMVGGADASADAISMPDEEGKVTLDLSALKVPGSEEYELSMESAKALGLLMKSGVNSTKVLENKLKKLGHQVKLVSSASKIVKESKGFTDTVSSLISEVEDTYSYLQRELKGSAKSKSYLSLLETYHKTLNQLTEQKMNKRTRTLSEADITLKLTGMPDEVDLDSIGVDLITGGDEGGGDEEEGDEEDLDLGDEGEGEESDESEGGDEEELDLDLDDEGEESEEEEKGSEEKMESRRLRDDVIVEIDEGMLRREISRMKALREAKEDVQSWGHGAGSVSDEFEDDDLGDPFVDIDLRESQDDSKKSEADMDEAEMDELDQAMTDEAEMDELDQAMMDELDQDSASDGEGSLEKEGMYELDQAMTDEAEMDELDQAEDTKEYGGVRDEAQTQKQSRQAGATVESLRRRLRAEARIQLEAKQKAQSAKKQAQKKQQEAQKMQKEAQQKKQQGKKQEAQKKQKEAQQKKQQGKKMQEAYNYFATRFNESVRRSNKIKGMLSESARRGSTLNGASPRSAAETNNLRTKLAETNLFNAKLLFTNKLLQNESLTKRQKAEVIERLDEARNEREVKLVYESLVRTLQGSDSRKLTESAERGVIGSSSRPARPASATNTLNEGFEADRWARLAGIVK